jgi:ATP-dependent RNA helicase RhlE
VLVVTPTRELAMQVAEMAAAYGRHVPLRSAVVFGGVPLDPQIKELRAGVELLVATPGRLLDLVGQRAANLGQVEILVLDEGDRMLDMGFIPDIRRILELIPNRKQTLLFSATFSDEIRRLSKEFLTDPAVVEVAARNATASAVREVLYPVDRELKLALLEHLVVKHDLRQVLVFTRTKIAARRIASDLDRHGFAATAIHSDRTQAERIRALADFKSGEVEILVATDVASRGLDIEELPVVVNFELPTKAEDYVHRIGRTGRAGASGIAISLACPDEVDLLRAIQRLLRRSIPVEVVEQFLPDPDTPPRPIHARGGDGIPQHRHKAERVHRRR